MSAVTVHNLPEATHRALRARAQAAGRSTEAEICLILEDAVHPPERVGLGTLLHQIGLEAGGFDFEIEREPAREPVSFE
jgi:plasmid stability protein